MSTFNPTIGTRTSLSFTGTALSTLASATYVKNTTAYNCDTNKPMNVVVEVEAATTNTPSGNKQLLVFIKESLDGTNFREGPESGTTATRENNLRLLGVLPITTASTTERGFFDIFSILGFIPKSFFVVIKNDLGVALTAGVAFTSEVSGVST